MAERSEDDFLYPGVDAGEPLPTIELLRDTIEQCLTFAQAGAPHQWPGELEKAIAIANATLKAQSK